MLKIEKVKIEKINTEAIIIPSNGIASMNNGIAEVIRSVGGKSIQDEAKKIYAQNKKPFLQGSFYITKAGTLENLGIKYIFHAVLVKYPNESISMQNIILSLEQIFKEATKKGICSITVFELGTDCNVLDKDSIARNIISISRKYCDKLDITISPNDERFEVSLTKFML